MSLAASVLHPAPSLSSIPSQLQREGEHADSLGFSSLSGVSRAAHPSLHVEGQIWLSPRQGLLADELRALWGSQQGKIQLSQVTPCVSQLDKELQ